MNKNEEKANEIIDRVSEIIEEYYPEIKPKHLTDDDSIEYPALINGTLYYELESEIAGIISKEEENKDYFDIPSMSVHRDDIIAQYEGRDDFEEIREKINNLSDEQMQDIANNMTDMMMEQFNLAVGFAFEKQMEYEE